MTESEFSKPKPLVALAALFDRVLHEKDNVPTLIRMVDQFTVAVPPPELAAAKVKPMVKMTLGIGLKAGGVPPGSYELEVVLRGPTKTQPPTKVPIMFPDKNLHTSGANVFAEVAIVIDAFGDC